MKNRNKSKIWINTYKLVFGDAIDKAIDQKEIAWGALF